MRHTIYCVLCVLITVALGVTAMRYIAHTWVLAFFESLQTHFALACMVAALLALLIRRHWYAVVLLLASAILTAHSVLMLHEHALAATPPAAGQSFRLLSFNIDNENVENGKRIADFILGSGADVVEIFEAQPVLPQIIRLSERYPYRIGCGVMTDGCDSLLMSRYPLAKQSIGDLGIIWRNRLIMTTIDLNGTPVTFASAHLSKPYFDDFHDEELRDLYHILKEITGPLILAGDFNAAVIAPDMRYFLTRADLHHVFPEPSTWPIAAGPLGIGIDHVFARLPARLTSVKRIPDNMGSNHYGLISEFTIK